MKDFTRIFLDRIIHGYQIPNLDEPTKQLEVIVNELVTMWKRKDSGENRDKRDRK